VQLNTELPHEFNVLWELFENRWCSEAHAHHFNPCLAVLPYLLNILDCPNRQGKGIRSAHHRVVGFWSSAMDADVNTVQPRIRYRLGVTFIGKSEAVGGYGYQLKSKFLAVSDEIDKVFSDGGFSTAEPQVRATSSGTLQHSCFDFLGGEVHLIGGARSFSCGYLGAKATKGIAGVTSFNTEDLAGRFTHSCYHIPGAWFCCVRKDQVT